ncbi:cell division topological specificity factor MinE [Methylobacterium sp. NEAU 140]|uniref:cell division topological specificity factor MinE n=1 Tax=Methylobacterium sp. NEAU 140 TaxID=3064945 RepID=UPI002735C524|nr:cell division topological specificity factor MinE [Methylobacterium sp. NEAU 140]MDP4022669.1 cell division topological specificity factor MinE [Methylobacterium sp. NEAU 140]
MSILGIFQKRSSGAVARDRLQLILAHERAETSRPDLVLQLREEILAVIANHVSVEPDKVKMTLERGEGVSTLGLDIELPLGASGRLDAKLAAKIAQVAEKAGAEAKSAAKKAA